jgi:hypothetical protein
MMIIMPKQHYAKLTLNFRYVMVCLFAFSISMFQNFAWNILKNQLSGGRRWWLKPIILATQEADIRRTTVQSQPRQIVHETLA